MVSFEISFIDIFLMIGIALLITVYVTLLIRLKPSHETTIDEYAKKQATSPQTPLKTFKDHKPPIQTSKPITIAEAIQMRQTSTATIETAKETEIPKTTKTPKAPIVYIENQRNIEHKQEVPKTSKKLEAPKTEERQPPTPPPIQTPTNPPMSVDMGLPKGSPECAHYFGYLRTLPKNTPIPDECFGCTRIMECFMQG
jgi:Ca2+/Na+ antiporter